jgi:hypothetical protein
MPCPYCHKPTPREEPDSGILGVGPNNCVMWFCKENPENKKLFGSLDDFKNEDK